MHGPIDFSWDSRDYIVFSSRSKIQFKVDFAIKILVFIKWYYEGLTTLVANDERNPRILIDLNYTLVSN